MASTMTEPGLTQLEREHFLEHGYVLLKGVFPRDWALNEVREQFAANGMDADKPETWREPRMSLAPTKSLPIAEIAPRLRAAACEILGGDDRIRGGESLDNGMTASCFTGEGKPWSPPDERDPWHKDGYFFRHFLDSPEQALLSLPLWSDVVPQGGGTYIAPQSVGVIARYLAEHPEGVHPNGFPNAELIRQCDERIEAVGSAGDVYLMHGYMVHTISANPNRRLRCISNGIFALEEPMNFNREDPADFSLLEQGVLRGIGVERYDFKPTRERVQTPDWSPLPLDLM